MPPVEGFLIFDYSRRYQEFRKEKKIRVCFFASGIEALFEPAMGLWGGRRVPKARPDAQIIN